MLMRVGWVCEWNKCEGVVLKRVFMIFTDHLVKNLSWSRSSRPMAEER